MTLTVDGKPVRTPLSVPITLHFRPDLLPLPDVLELPLSQFEKAGGTLPSEWASTQPGALA